MIQSLLKKMVVGLAAASVLLAPAFADEGMWLFNTPPSDYLQKKYGFAVTEDWLSRIRLSSVRFGGASAAFISPDGLVLTNHHVGRGAIQNLSTKDRDLMRLGFYARTRGEELRCPGVELRVLQDIEDVTDAITAAEKPGMSPDQAAEARDKAIADMEKDFSEKTGLRCSVVALYSGGLYHLHEYRVYTDVRLVFAVENAVAFFGGDADNFTYPRYDLDISIFRVYENGNPLPTPHFLRWASKGVREGDLVFCSGNPGSTGRLLTAAQLEFLRDVEYPLTLGNLKRRQALLHRYSKKGSEEARIALNQLFGIENSLKARTGYDDGLRNRKLMGRKAEEEKSLRGELAKTPALQEEYGNAWDEIADAQKRYASFFKPHAYFERGHGFDTAYFNIARNIVRLAMEKPKPNAERLREYQDSNLVSLRRRILSVAPIHDDFESYKLADSLNQLRRELGDRIEVRWILGGRTPEEAAEELIAGTKLKDIEIRKAYLDGGRDAVYQSEDTMIKLALLLDPVSRGLRSRHEKGVEAVEKRNGALIARALFKVKGTSVAPDANSTLRLSFGVVKGYSENGRKIPYRTTFAGLFERSKKFENKPPFDLPPGFAARKSALNLNAPLNFVATVDATGGNSGSPIVDRKGELVGVLFDGNIQSLPTNFFYEEEISRSVMVDGQGIVEALLKAYDAKPLVEEIRRAK